ncbi:CHAT domain-containing protein [Microcoleus sp. A6-C5]|uniref:CHAT domain-containing protein n=1 Tax=Microcoleus sp. A6-C5 TaxID=2818547 RepID=UPI002FD3A82E
MFDKIWQFLKQLIQRIFGTNRPISTPQQPPTVTDAEFEAKFMELLEGVNDGWASGDVTEFLIAKRLRDTEFADWLRRFGERLLAIDRETTEEGGHGETASTDSVSSLQELARQLELLRGICGGELGEVARNVGREILVKFPISPVGDGEGEGEVDGEAEVWYKRGNEQFELGNFEEAVAFYDRSIEFKYNAPEVWEKRALALQKLGDYQGAIDSNNTASTLYRYSANPDSASVYHSKDFFLSRSNIKSSFNQALEIRLYDYESWYNRGIALHNLGRLEEAIASYNRALEIKPYNHEAWNNRGSVLDDLGRLEAAIASYDKALELKPDDYVAWYNRGIALNNLGRLEEAIASYDKALEFKPDYDDAWNNRGGTLYNLGRWEEAIASYDKALELKPDDDNTLNNRGFALGNLGRSKEAITSYDKALELKPDDEEAWYNRGKALDNLGFLEEAIASYDKALEFKLDFHNAWRNRGVALYKLDKLEEALVSCDKALELKSDDDQTWYGRGIVLGDLERLKEALLSYDKALKLKPDERKVWKNRGVALVKLVRFEEAIASWDKALELKPEDHGAWINRSNAVSNAPKYNQVVYEILQAEFPDSPPITRTILTHNLKQRGYEGQILTLQAGLEYCQQNTHPEGYGELHQALGNAHYDQGKLNSPYTYWSKAAASYKAALKTLTKEAFLKLHLEVIQALIKTLFGLKEVEEANKLRRDATDLLQRLLTDKNYSQLSEAQLADKLVRFEQLTVNILIQSGKLIEALETAEQDKNVCLSWLLNALPIPYYQEETAATVTHAQIQQLLNPTTCAIYWHLSDAALTTFIIKSDGLLSPEDCYTKSPDEFEEWVKKWNQQYADYQDKSKENANKQNHAWRAGMPSKFAHLKDILQIAHIEQQLQSNGITNLILIPHRDLHRFPIHALFSSEFVITYLPSAQFGLNLKHRLNSEISRLSPSSDPPKSPLRRGTLNTPVSPDTTGILNTPVSPGTMETLNTLVPPFLRGARGDLASAINDKNSILSIENPDSIIIDENGKRKKLLPLPAAEIESEIICRMFANSTRRGENAATLDEVTKLLPQPHHIFHFTGHGSYDFDNPQQSTLYLSDTHRLTVKEIIQLNLSNYKLICLSACETAVTDKQTILAEYVGLISGFMCAGVGCVVSTLWPVESGASTLLMIDFYRRWREGGDSLPVALANSQKWLQSATGEDLATWCQREIDKISENSSELSEDEVSLRRFFKSNRQNLAKIGLDQPYQHPYYWAAFTLTGL